MCNVHFIVLSKKSPSTLVSSEIVICWLSYCTVGLGLSLLWVVLKVTQHVLSIFRASLFFVVQ